MVHYTVSKNARCDWIMNLDKILKVILIAAIVLTLLSAIVIASSPASSSHRPDVSFKNKNAIFLKNAQFDTTVILPSEVPTSILSTDADVTNDYYIVQFRGHIKEEMKKAVKNTGAEIFDYVPNNAFIVQMDPATKMQVESLDVVQWVGVYQPAYRISPALSASIAKKNVIGSAKVIYENVTLLLFNAKDNGRVLSEIRRMGGEVVESSGDRLLVRIEGSKISDISIIGGVSWIEKYVQPEISNDIAATIINVNEIQGTHGLTGAGQIVAVADSGLDTGFDNPGIDGDIHLDFDNRVTFINYIGLSADDTNGHGTHTTGSVAGNGSRSGGAYQGMAPDADIIFQGLGDDAGSNSIDFPSGGFTKVVQDAYNIGARIHSDSWGDPDAAGAYDTLSQETDQFVWDNKDIAIFMAAGNDGVSGINSPGTAKNVITVGASDSSRFGGNINDIAIFSSRGPTDDGRIKPDVVAPGRWILSTRSSMPGASYSWGIFDDYYAYSGGTSMSTPITAGAAALVRQYYVDNESISPSAALIKASMINGAVNLSLSSNSQGWGRINITNSLFPNFPSSVYYHDENSGGGLSTSEIWNYSYNVTNSTIPLRITLVWTDYKGSPLVIPQLVNDLDLVVTGPFGSYLGNGGDSANNVEQVELPAPSVGIYTIQVNGTNIPHGPQPFALVISGAANGYGYVNGSVEDNITKAGIGGAIVDTGTGITNVTNESGFYSLFLEEGSYNLNVTGGFEYYSNSSVVVEVQPDATIVQDVELAKKPVGVISGIVTRS